MKKLSSLLLLLALSICWSYAQQAKYVFYFIGDGMGVNQVQGTEIYRAELEGKMGITPLLFTQFPYSTVAITNSATNRVTDSAAAGTALATGRKTKNSAIGVLKDQETPINSVAVWAKNKGCRVGIATSVTVNHATPGAFYAHAAKRTLYHEIGKDLYKTGFDFYAGSDFRDATDKNNPTTDNLYEMTGIEMCLQIKNNVDLCHIPIILLTALNNTEQSIEGLNRGADDYISKPFNAQLLLARANNLVRNRLLIQHQLRKKPLSEIDLTSINPLDQEMLRKTSQIIEKHIDDPDFDIPELCKEVGIGRSLLYSKFKALTGMTPNNFVLNYRLKHAATLLRRYSDLPIAEVSDRCGFSSPVYFSRCFKNQYGCTPQSYQKRKDSEV